MSRIVKVDGDRVTLDGETIALLSTQPYSNQAFDDFVRLIDGCDLDDPVVDAPDIDRLKAREQIGWVRMSDVRVWMQEWRQTRERKL